MKIWLSEELAANMLAAADKFGSLETGGILLGWRNDDGWIATGLIGPGPRAEHRRGAFVPDHEHQVRQLKIAFAHSGGDLDYLGDWHTHPTGPARMSMADRRTLRRINRKTTAPVMVILDPTGAEPDFGAWTCGPSGWLGPAIKTVGVHLFRPLPSWPSFREADHKVRRDILTY